MAEGPALILVYHLSRWRFRGIVRGRLRGLRPLDTVHGLAVGPGSGSLRPEAQGSKASRAKRVEVIDDFLSEDVGIGKVVGLFEACVSESKDIEAGLVPVDEIVVIIGLPGSLGSRFRPCGHAALAQKRFAAPFLPSTGPHEYPRIPIHIAGFKK